MNKSIQEMVDNLEKEHDLLQKEGPTLIHQRIKKFLENDEKVEPIVDVDALTVQIEFYKQGVAQNIENMSFWGNVLNDYYAKCFKIKLLEYKLYLKNK